MPCLSPLKEILVVTKREEIVRRVPRKLLKVSWYVRFSLEEEGFMSCTVTGDMCYPVIHFKSFFVLAIISLSKKFM